MYKLLIFDLTNSYFSISDISLCIILSLMLWKEKIIIVVQKHHFFLLAISVVLIIIIILIYILAIFLELFQFICVCSSDELTVHIKDLTLWVHQKFTIISLNLNSSHYHIIFHIDANLFSFFCCWLLSVIFIY